MKTEKTKIDQRTETDFTFVLVAWKALETKSIQCLDRLERRHQKKEREHIGRMQYFTTTVRIINAILNNQLDQIKLLGDLYKRPILDQMINGRYYRPYHAPILDEWGGFSDAWTRMFTATNEVEIDYHIRSKTQNGLPSNDASRLFTYAVDILFILDQKIVDYDQVNFRVGRFLSEYTRITGK